MTKLVRIAVLIISWQWVAGTGAAWVFRYDPAGKIWEQIANVANTSPGMAGTSPGANGAIYSDGSPLNPGTTYYYSVCGYNRTTPFSQANCSAPTGGVAPYVGPIIVK